MDDETLIAQIAAGDQAAMSEFYSRWFPQFARLATRLTGDSNVGEDIAMDAVVRVLSKASSYRPGQSPQSWLLAIVYNRVRDRWRREEVRHATSLSEPAGSEDGPKAMEVPDREPTATEKAEARERETAVQAALASLTEAEREVIILRDYRGLSAPETAKILKISTETVGGRLFRARKRLGAVLQTEWPGLFPSHEL